ncbi:protein FAM193A isoform X1 [Osmerus mordax]|uniref:protein FAM193A isoform X1 n=1 Tax=Osmerus mordax TaxID=8014 RepID=UPI003510B46A
MSPTDAKRGAKRRKNKRGGGSSCSTVCSTSGKAGVSATALSPQSTATPSVLGFLTSGSTGNGNIGSITGMNGEVPMNGNVTQFTEGPVNSDFSGVLQTPFTFGLNQRAPYTTGDRCLLCRSERKDNGLQQEVGLPGQNGTTASAKPPSALQLPLWVCPDCRHTVEKEDHHAVLEDSLGNQNFLLHMPLGNGGVVQEPVSGGRLTSTAPTLPMLPAPDLTAPLTADTVCSCEACNERREISAESERESQQLQNHWSEVRYLVRGIYRQTSTPCDKEGMKELVDRLCEKDPYQLYQRLEQQAREYVLEMKVRLLKHLSSGSKSPPTTAAGPARAGSAGGVGAPQGPPQGPPQAHQFISLLLEEYSALCQAARTISSFLLTLENEHLQKFQVTWELHNKHLFENLVFSEPILHSSLPALVAQLRHGTASHDSYSEDMFRTLLESHQRLEQEMAAVATEWQDCEKRIDDYVDEQLLFKGDGQSLAHRRPEPHKSLVSKNTLKTKQRMLKEDWEFFKQTRFIEEQLTNSKKSLAGDSNFTDTMRMLSSRLSIPDCPNCNYRRRCTCDDCSLSHILTCGILDSSIAEDLHIKLPLQAEAPPLPPHHPHPSHHHPHRDYLVLHPPSLSSGASSASGSASSSPITIQQHPRLILPQGGGNTFGSDDDEVPPLSAKFGDIYPMSGYEDPGVLPAMNGLHSQLNGGGENKESPQGSSSSSSSSEGDEEEADVESGGEPPGHKREHSPGKSNSPPPSYHHHQMEQIQHACECHVCYQDSSSSALGHPGAPLPPSRLHGAPAPHFFTSDAKAPPSHPALQLYPHIHGHLPLHTLSHLPRPLLHPTLYPPSPPLSHNKPLPPAPTSNHSAAKQPAFSPTLPDHVYQSCFGNGGGGAGDWNSSLQCLSLKFENLCDAAMMKNWNPSMLLQEPLPGDILGPPLPDVPLPPPSSSHHGDHPISGESPLLLPPPSSSSSSSSSSYSSSEHREQKKSGAKKKCLYNFQDAFLEANRVVMATSASTASVSCTATTVQSSNNPSIHLASKRPNSLGDVFHSLGKEDHRLMPPGAPRNSPTGLALLPPLSDQALPLAPSTHLPSMALQPFPQMAAPVPSFMEAHQGMCLSPAEPPAPPAEGPISAPPSICSDPECEGHRCEGSGAYEHQAYDGEESQDEDSCSEHSSSTSTSTNQKEGKYCDCCYCEFFGHGGPPAAPTSRNYAEMREKLRLRLTRRKEEQPKREEPPPVAERDMGVEDHRRVEDLLQFINSADNKPASSSKAAKRARHKQKKMEEKARVEAEAREREEQHFLEEQQRLQREEEEEAQLQRDLLRLQELQHLRAAKKKRKERPKDPAPPNNPQPLKQTAQNVLENLQNGKSQFLHSLMCLPGHKEPRLDSSAPHIAVNGHPAQPPAPSPQHSPKSTREKASGTDTLSITPLQNGTTALQPDINGRAKPKQQQPGRPPTGTNGARKPHEGTPKGLDLATKIASNSTTNSTTISSTATDTKADQPRPVEEPGPVQSPERRREERSNGTPGRKPQQLLTNQAKEERRPPVSNPSPPPVLVPVAPPALHTELPQQNGKVPRAESPHPRTSHQAKAESPQPTRAKAKKNKKKKGEKTNSSIDDVFLPKDIDLDSTDIDETEREVEYFKRFCLDSARQTRQRLSINWSNFSLKKATFAAH